MLSVLLQKEAAEPSERADESSLRRAAKPNGKLSTCKLVNLSTCQLEILIYSSTESRIETYNGLHLVEVVGHFRDLSIEQVCLCANYLKIG